MYEYDLFLSYAKQDTTTAQTVEKRAKDKGLRVFFAKSELSPGVRWQNDIRSALLRSREIAVLMTPDSLGREWVISEWSCGWLLDKVVTAIVKDIINLKELPERLLEFQIADYYKQLDEFLDAVVERKRKDPSCDADMSIYRHFACQPGVLETLFAPQQGASPFVFNKQLGLAKRRILVAGQNLYSLTALYGQENEGLLFDDYLVRSERPKAHFMVCDPTKKEPVKTWKLVTKGEYERDLWVSIVFLKRWLDKARKAGLDNFEAKAVEFVPVSMTFIDPPESIPNGPRSGKLFITPNAFEPHSKVRSCFLLYEPTDTTSFGSYWNNFETTYSRGTDLSEIDVPSKWEEEAVRVRRELAKD